MRLFRLKDGTIVICKDFENYGLITVHLFSINQLYNLFRIKYKFMIIDNNVMR